MASGTGSRRLAKEFYSKLQNMLKLPKAARWCYYEWFYSDIDRWVLNDIPFDSKDEINNMDDYNNSDDDNVNYNDNGNKDGST